MKRGLIIVLLIAQTIALISLKAQDYQWSTTGDTILRDGNPFFLIGQSWAKKTEFTHTRGEQAENDVKKVLTELHQIGVNTIRIYGSPDDSDWDGSSNFHNLIKWIEEWNVDNPDGGDPSKAIYYLVQLSPTDPLSPISSDLPENSNDSYHRAINDLNNPESVASLVQKVDDLTGGSKYLMGYLIYHELNVSSKYSDWKDAIGLQGIDDFMNTVADSLHNNYAPGKLVTHTGDAKDDDGEIYQAIEDLDQIQGNVFQNFDMLGFNLYISSDALISENRYYRRIVNRRALSVNDDRGWYIGETGPSFDKSANSSSVAAANYTNPEGGANLQLMYAKSTELGNLIGHMLFTVQDNDLDSPLGDDIKQRGYYDVFGEKKFLYYIYPDVLSRISSNHRRRITEMYQMELNVQDNENDYQISFLFENYSDDSNKTFRYSIHSDNGSGGSQRFGQTISDEYLTLGPCESVEISETVAKPQYDLVVASASLIKELSPENAYLWGREHILEDAICTVVGLNQFLDNPQEVSDITPACSALPADLNIEWSTDLDDIFYGDTVNFFLKISNEGPSDATEIEANLDLSTGFSILEVSTEIGNLSNDFNTWIIGALGKNASAEIHFTVKILEVGNHDLTAQASGLQDDPSSINNEADLHIFPLKVLGTASMEIRAPILRGKVFLGSDSYIKTPPGFWTLKVYDLSGMQIIHKSIVGGQVLNLQRHTNRLEGVAVYFLEPNSGP